MKHQHLLNINLELTGKKLKKAFEESQYEEYELAEYLKVSIRTIKYWKSGDRLPSMDNLFYLRKILDKSIEELISFEDEVSNYDLNEELKGMGGDGPSPFMYFYRKMFKIKSVEDFLAFLPFYDVEVLNDVLYRISGESINRGTYMLEQFDYLYSKIENKIERDKIYNKLENDIGIWNTHSIVGIVDAERYEMVKMSSIYKGKSIDRYINDLICKDFAENGLEFNENQKTWIESIKSSNNDVDDFLNRYGALFNRVKL